MAISTPPERVAFESDDGVEFGNVTCASWTPFPLGPQACDFLVMFITSNGPCALDIPLVIEDPPDSVPWTLRGHVCQESCLKGCPVTLTCYTKMVEHTEVQGVDFCVEWEMAGLCRMVEVYRFTGVSQATPVIAVDQGMGCADGCSVFVSMPDITSTTPGVIGFTGAAVNLCATPFDAEFNAGDDWWSTSDRERVCEDADGAHELDTQWANIDSSGDPMTANFFWGAGAFCIRTAMYGWIDLTLLPGPCSFTPVVGDTRLGGSLSQYPALPPTLTGRGRIGITSTSSYSIDSSNRPEELEAVAAARIVLDL